MKKLLVEAFIFIFAASNTICPLVLKANIEGIVVTYPQDSEFQFPKVNGNYKECTIYNYIYNNGKIDLKSRKLVHYFEFNKKGLKIEERIYFDNSGNFLDELNYWYNIFHYDVNGNLKKITKYNHFNNYYYTFEYDTLIYNNKEKLIAIVNYEGNEDLKYIQYIDSLRYDEFGNNYEKQHCIPDHDLIKEYYKYDNNGILIEKIYHNMQSDLLTITYNYDNEGKILYMTNIRDKIWGGYDFKIVFKYDKYGNIIEWVYYKDFKEPVEKFECIYSK